MVIGIDIHRIFGRWCLTTGSDMSRIDMTRTALEGCGKILLASDEGGRSDRQ
ncbi:hypothetical protein QA641_36705 [Bradyrhizobium sp. CB1650]|uniref:hypothetical protein n=1 Tax=Bradyrhizobium sp. CB1650 TaxID=3039153 RepID=UPI002434E367|nr:hypothetical protein [Bradyrhizobium sp. CB1650]WGD51049.1 hypothetical protein QA641_36705 [Bradyrhizobium sp. CB1650]